VVSGQAEQADDEVAEDGQDVGSVPGFGLVEVFTEGDVADPVEPVLDVPVVADPGGQFGWCGLFCGKYSVSPWSCCSG
jgi:hypothetical protein